MKNMRLLLVYCLLIHHIAMFGMKKVLKPFAIAQKNYKKIPVEDLKAAVKYFTDKREKFEPNKKAYDFFSQYQALGSNIESKRLLLAELEHTYLIDRLGILKLAYENNVKEILEEVDLDRLLKLYADWGPNLDQDLRTDIRRFTDTLIRSETPITNFAFCGEAPLVLLETMPDRNKSPVYVPKLIENYAFSKQLQRNF